jgi:ABC-type multidrug transport system fused ATPase/permease subunit
MHSKRACQLSVFFQIQTVIKEELVEATVITIAHRLRTTFGLDRIVVLQDGAVVEFDTPRKLLEKDG